MNVLKKDQQIQIVKMAVEGCSIRSIERMTGNHRDTVMRLLVRTGDHCGKLMDEHMRNIHIQYLQIDEIWNFVAKKQRQVCSEDPEEYGDVYTFVAIDQDSKLVPAFLVGKRTDPNTRRFMDDLADRIEGRVQITTDGWSPYPGAVRSSFNGRAAYGQVVKNYAGGTFDDVSRRYSPPRLSSIRRHGMWGFPNARYMSTSHVERQNLTMRMQMRRFTRLTNAFSKKLVNLRAAVALHFANYNFVRRHSAHDLTPAVMAGVASNQWSVEDLLSPC